MIESPLVSTRRGQRLGLLRWLHRRYRAAHERESFATRTAAVVLTVFGVAAMAMAVLGIPTGLGTAADLALLLGLYLAALALARSLLAVLLAMLYIPLPRRLLATWCLVALQMAVILHFAQLSWLAAAVAGALYAAVALGCGSLLGLLLPRGRHVRRRAAKLAAVGTALCGMAVWAAISSAPSAVPERSGDGAMGEGESAVVPLAATNPSRPGEYRFTTFNYGSGEDKHRKWFGEKTELQSETADASRYVTKWSGLKSLFWGFDASSLPLNGTVWLPKGEGPFPLALIVHGNHLMEYFSDGGYSYLGELLASKGMIAISVDANFLNYSAWSDIPNDDMKLRAWLLLKHLEQIRQFDRQGNTLFSDKIDWNHVALIGHSRGGQAAAMAADHERWFGDEAELELDYATIRSVVALAPTDTVVDGKSAVLQNINYLTLQGARDADISNFYGERQYNRTRFTEGSGLFKASLYIGDANHSQFNMDWGRLDDRLPAGLLFNRKDMLTAKEQRLIAKVYISAFLETTLLGQADYRALFQNYQSGLHWLPETLYANRYEGSDFVEAARFDGGKGLVARFEASGMPLPEQAEAKDRQGVGKGTSGAVLQWEEPGAEYVLELADTAEPLLASLEGGSLVFSISNLEWELLEAALEEDVGAQDDGGRESDADSRVETDRAGYAAGDGGSPAEATALQQLPPLPELEIVIADEAGVAASVSLADVMSPQPPAYTSFLIADQLAQHVKSDKFKQPAEAVFQTFIVPLDIFTPEEGAEGAEGETLAPEDIASIVFRFESGPGKIMVDDIGFLPQGGTYVEFR